MPLRSVAVFGGGLVAQAAALAFARALPRAEVSLIATPRDPAALADRFPTVWPSSMSMLDRLGLDGAALLANGAANPLLARRFEHWSRTKGAWLLPEGEAVRLPGAGLLHQRWLESARSGDLPPFHALFPAAALAEAGRFTPEPENLLSTADPVLRLDPDRIGRLLAEGCTRTRVRAVPAGIAAVDRDASGAIASVRLDNGGVLAADLFIDATGPRAHLCEGGGFDDWATALPCDRLLLQADPGQAPSLVDVHAAGDIGWTAQWSMPSGGVRVLGYAAATGEERARRTFASGRAAVEAVALRPGRLRSGWKGNVLALGDAAVQPGPLGLAGFSLALAQLSLALDLLPGRDMEPLLLAEYNRRAGLRADRLRDFLAALHLAGNRRRGPFWRALDASEPPAGLARTVEQFKRRGLVPRFEEESVNAYAWQSVLIGQGFRPERRDPVAMGTDADATGAALQSAQSALAAAARAVPAYGAAPLATAGVRR